jgi:hypothetical protein
MDALALVHIISHMMRVVVTDGIIARSIANIRHNIWIKMNGDRRPLLRLGQESKSSCVVELENRCIKYFS